MRRIILGVLGAALCLSCGALAAAENSPPATQPALAEMYPSDRTLDLLVADQATKQPLAGVKVDSRLNDNNADSWQSATDATGHVAVPLPRKPFDRFRMRIRFPGYVGEQMQWPMEEDNHTEDFPSAYTISLERGTKIFGHVVDDAGKAVAGAHVVVYFSQLGKALAPHEALDRQHHTVVTAADGAWSYDEAPSHLEHTELGVWDYQYVMDACYESNEVPASKLLDGTTTLTVLRGLPLEGVVLGPDGKPLAGANVGLGRDRVCSNTVPWQKTDSAGHFAFAVKPDTDVVLTVTAAGCSPQLQRLTLSQAKRDLAIRLESGHRLSGRVVYADGHPVARASVWMDTWRDCRTLNKTLRTDNDGRFVWDDAPADTVYCDVVAPNKGSMYSPLVPLTAGQDNLVTLHRAIHVHGTVTDAQTGQAIDAFRLIWGVVFDQTQPVVWRRFNVKTKSYGGKFDFTLTDPYPGYAVRIEADGYTPADSRTINLNEIDVSLDMKLSRGADVVATILSPDGHPAADATVALISAGVLAHLENGRVITGDVLQTTADAGGRARFPAQNGPFLLVAIHPKGYAQIDSGALGSSGHVYLQAWASIQGSLMIGNKPGSAQTVAVEPDERIHDLNQPHIFQVISTLTNADGSFSFDRVPPGEVWIFHQLPMRPGGISPCVQIQRLTAKADETLTVKLGGMGRRVEGHVDIPPELAQRQDWLFGFNCEISTKVKLPEPPPLPDEIKNAAPEKRLALVEQYLKSPECKPFVDAMAQAAKAQDAGIRWDLEIQPDGRFWVDDVPAGMYSLSINVAQRRDPHSYRGIGVGETIGTGNAEFTVPPMPTGRSDQPLELPPVQIELHKLVTVGEPAPDFSVKTLDGKDLKLSSFRGKYVLLDFWATWCGPCRGETPNLKATYDAFAKDDRFVMISLSLDSSPDGPKEYAQSNGMAWTQCFLGDWNKDTVTKDYGVRGIPSIWLIGPDGKVIAKNLSGGAIKSAVTAALAK